VTLEEIRDRLVEWAPPGLRFSIRHGTLWVETGSSDDLAAAATGSVSVDPPYARVSGSATLSHDPVQAEVEARQMLQLARTMVRAQELLGVRPA